MNERIYFSAVIKCEVSQSKTYFWTSWWNLKAKGRIESKAVNVAW